MRRFQVGDTVKRVREIDECYKNHQKGAIFKVAKLTPYGDIIDENGTIHWKDSIELVEPVEAQTNNPKPQSNLAFLARDFADLIKAQIEKPSPDNAKRINLVIASIQKELGGADA